MRNVFICPKCGTLFTATGGRWRGAYFITDCVNCNSIAFKVETRTEQREDLTQIANHYGILRQITKLCEEINELQRAANQAIIELVCDSKLSRTTTDNLVDELADVAIMVEQVAYLADAVDAVKERVEFKVNRQLERIAAEVNNEQPDN